MGIESFSSRRDALRSLTTLNANIKEPCLDAGDVYLLDQARTFVIHVDNLNWPDDGACVLGLADIPELYNSLLGREFTTNKVTTVGNLINEGWTFLVTSFVAMPYANVGEWKLWDRDTLLAGVSIFGDHADVESVQIWAIEPEIEVSRKEKD